MNLPMLVKLAKVRSNQPLADAVDCAQNAGRKYIAAASHVLHGDGSTEAAGERRRRQRHPTRSGRRQRQPPVLCRAVIDLQPRGLHARAAAKFVTLAERFGASVEVVRTARRSPPARSWA